VTRDGHKPAQEVAAYSWGLEGRWLKLNYTLSPGETDLRPVTTEAYETFDASLKKWVYVSVSSDASYGTSYSDGWQGNVKVYGPAANEPERFKFTATKVNDQEFTEVGEVPSAGQWRVVFSLRCRKVE
jgi:hypothetical protein